MHLPSVLVCRVPLHSSNWKEAHIQVPEQNENLVAPWLVKVFGNGKICQGVILSNWWVLTAASCFLLMKPSHVELIGIHGRFSTITVSQTVSHRGFSSWDAAPNSDLGLVLLAQPIDLRREDVWPVCVPHRQESPDVLVHCNIFERSQNRPKKWLLNRIMVHILVPIGSPVICRDPAREQWELVGIVSQSLQDCTAPVLATQVVPHHQWLWKEGAVVNHFQPQHTKTASAIHRTSSLESPVWVTMEQCEMGLAWNSNSHTYRLNKMAILMDHRVGCGLRPGFVPKCPSCSEAEVGEFPWIVSLKLSIRHICAGSILNPRWILTTANCANLIKNSEALALAQAGLADVSEEMHSIPIRQALTHPHWLASNVLHNVGLLQLEKPLDMGPLIAPTCLLNKANMIGDFKDCWLPGWTVLEGGLTILLRYPLDTLSISNCNPFREQHSSAIFCMKAQRGQKGACKGDVGSPLICRDPQSGAWLQLGVLSSFDEACSRPYVFNSLPHYLPWLENTTRTAGHHDNLTLPWEWQNPTKHLRVLQEPETLIKQISAHFSLPWQVLIATCGNRSCVGSILDRYWVLTTGQCVQEVDPANTAVFVGLAHPSGQVQGIRVAAIYPHERVLQYSLTGGYTMALLLLQKPISFDQHVSSMSFSQMKSWDSCKVMGLQLLQSGEVETDHSVYQVKVLSASECAKELPGVNPNVYCLVRHTTGHKPAATVGEGAALLCRLEAKNTTWSQVGLINTPFPGSQPVVLSSSITSYVNWMEETSKQAKHILSLTSGKAAYSPSSWMVLLLWSLFGATELG
ncbi:serine protease 53-like [Tiliqua scincoides]|uniref:serine protease 53-like n=1 Tax=Tiliqua scincoides TaxID=71010 RepID=UPI003461D437